MTLAVALAACSGSAAPRTDPGQPAPAASAAPVRWKPISLAILEDYDKGQDLGEIARDFGRFRELGITTWRGSFGWDDYEPAPGEYDFAWLREFAALARDSGITLRPYLGYTPAWAAVGRSADGQVWNDPPRDTAAWARFVDTLAAALGSYPNVASWEVYNEENVPLWWDGTVAEYNAVLGSAAARIRARDPDAAVLIGGTVWPDTDWLEATCEVHGNAGAFDVAPFHAYPETWPDTLALEDYLDEGYHRWYLAAVDSSCGGKPVWINEAGFATSPGKTEAQQARWWARAFAVFFAAPRVEHIGVYEIRDLRPESDVIGDAPNYFLGLLRTDGTPKAAFHTVRLLARLFRADSIAVADRALVVAPAPAALEHHLFLMPDGRQLAFLWQRPALTAGATEPGHVQVSLTFPSPGARAVRYALDGTGTDVPLREGRTVTLALDGADVAIVELLPGTGAPAR